MIKPPIIFLTGPTASGKTPLAIDIVRHFPCEIISVDSAMVYRGMDIGTAKPAKTILQTIPHHLIDIADPKERYSAGQFRLDALRCIDQIIKNGNIPLLVGGTMMYFHILKQGLAKLPQADPVLRTALQKKGEEKGWEVLHADLEKIDPAAAKRIHPRDSQRIQRALEVYELTGKTITEWQESATHPLSAYQISSIAIQPSDRNILHERIALRFQQMMKDGLIDEVKMLYERGDLSLDLPSIRSVNYRQVWDYLADRISYADMSEKAMAATRQLAKRQLTWLRAWKDVHWIISNEYSLFPLVKEWLERQVDLW